MDSQFTAVIQKLAAERGKDVLLNFAVCRALLADYTRGEYNRESRLFLQAVEAGVAKTIAETPELDACKARMARNLEEEHFLSPGAAANVVSLLALVLRDDPSGMPGADAGAGGEETETPGGAAVYYLSVNYKTSGPFEPDAVKAMIESGQVTGEYYLRAGNAAPWEPITSRPEFKTLLDAQSAPPPQAAPSRPAPAKRKRKTAARPRAAQSAPQSAPQAKKEPGAARWVIAIFFAAVWWFIGDNLFWQFLDSGFLAGVLKWGGALAVFVIIISSISAGSAFRNLLILAAAVGALVYFCRSEETAPAVPPPAPAAPSAPPAAPPAGETAESHWKRADEYWLNSDWDNAIRESTEAIQIDPAYANAWGCRGGAYRMKGQYDDAIKDLTEAIRLAPNYAFAWGRRGDTYRMKGQFGDAIKDLTEAIRLDPNMTFAWAGRGMAYFESGDTARAIQDLEKAIQLNPNYQWAKDRLAEIRGH